MKKLAVVPLGKTNRLQKTGNHSHSLLGIVVRCENHYDVVGNW